MARTYPAKRSRIATEADVIWRTPLPGGAEESGQWPCVVCGELLRVGDRIIEHPIHLAHAACANENGGHR